MPTAMFLHQPGSALQAEERPGLTAKPGELVVRLEAAALNHRDLWICKGAYPGIRLPVILGSDGAGVVTASGSAEHADRVGTEVILNPSLAWGDSSKAPGPDFTILGMPRDGTFAAEIVIPTEQVAAKPRHLDWQQAAALPLAGLTAFRALFSRARLQAGERVLITGIGGGVALLALQFAVAAGAEVHVTSSSEAKRQRALTEFGARGTYDHTDPEWVNAFRKTVGAFDVAIDGAGGNTFANLLEAAEFGARIVSYGATAGVPERINLRAHFWKQLDLLGSTMGSPADFAGMTAFVTRHAIRPQVDEVFPLHQANEALHRMESGSQFGKLVLRCQSSP